MAKRTMHPFDQLPLPEFKDRLTRFLTSVSFDSIDELIDYSDRSDHLREIARGSVIAGNFFIYERNPDVLKATHNLGFVGADAAFRVVPGFLSNSIEEVLQKVELADVSSRRIDIVKGMDIPVYAYPMDSEYPQPVQEMARQFLLLWDRYFDDRSEPGTSIDDCGQAATFRP